MTDEPLVSIFIPVYNGENYLAETLDSLLQQTFSRFEILIVNDGSTDATLQISKAYAQKDSRIRIVSHEVCRGLSAARNTGWRSSHYSSRYLMNHDSDDISFSKKLEYEVNFLERHSDIDAVGCFCRYIDEEGRDIGFPPLEWKPERIRRSFGLLNSMAVSATLVRREVFHALNGFRGDFGGCDDYDFWSRALRHGFRLANIPAFLHSIRKHSASYSQIHATSMAEYEKVIQAEYNKAMNISEIKKLWIRGSLKTLWFRMNNAVRNSGV